MQRQEIPHNSPEQVQEYVTRALALVETLDPPEDLRAAVFTQACALYSAKQLLLMEPPRVDLGGLVQAGRRH